MGFIARQAGEGTVQVMRTPTAANEPLNLVLNIPASLAERLASTITRNFAAEQPGRFIPLQGSVPGDAAADDPAFRHGTLMWTESVADAAMLHAVEEMHGHHVTLALDEAGADFGCGVVVVSSRAFVAGMNLYS